MKRSRQRHHFMLEILFIFGLIGWLAGFAWEFLSALAAFPTILTAAVAVPLVACADYMSIVQRFELAGMAQHRVPVPPERFYWTLHKNRLRTTLIWGALLAFASWWVAIAYPAELSYDWSSLIGWLAGLLAIFSTARVAAHGTVYVRASHWFDQMAPWAVGVCRRTMYRLSQNPDFLDSDDTKRLEKEKSVY